MSVAIPIGSRLASLCVDMCPMPVNVDAPGVPLTQYLDDVIKQNDKEIDVDTIMKSLNSLGQEQCKEQDTDKNKTDDPEIAALKKSVTGGELDARSPLGQKFSAWLMAQSDDTKQKYSSYKGRGAGALKREFRLDWAKERLATKTEVTREKLKQLQELHGKKGKYFSFDRICVEEGGLENPRAVRRAVSYVSNCVREGPPYILYDTWKSDVEFLYYEKVHAVMHLEQETMKKKESFGEEQAAHKPTGLQPRKTPTKKENTAEKALTTPVLPASKQQRRESPGPAGDKPSIDKPTPNAKKLKLTGDETKIMKEAQDVRMRTLVILGTQLSINESIEKDDAYSWAKTESQQQKFSIAADILDKALSSKLAYKFWLHNTEGVFKAKFGEPAFWQLLKSFAADLGEAVANYEKQHLRFSNMHLANLEA